MLGVHRFVTPVPGRDPVAETQRTTGMVLGYMTRMGVSSSVVEAMSATRDVRWLGVKEAAAMNLVTDPVREALSGPAINLNRSPRREVVRRTAAKKLACCGFFSPSHGRFRLCRGAAVDPRFLRNHAMSGFGQPQG